MRTLPALAAALLLAACGTDPEPAATPSPAPTASPSPTPTISYDPAWKTGFMTESGTGILEDRTYTFTSGGTGPGERLRPGVWKTLGGPCSFQTANMPLPRKGRTWEIDPAGGGWINLPVDLPLPEGATLTVVHDGTLRGDGCIWGWDKALS